jgi:hypothetical protein
VKVKGTVTTGEQSWLGGLFWVDAVNMLDLQCWKRRRPIRLSGICTPTPTVTALGKATCQFLGLRLERSNALSRLRQIAADGVVNCVAIPAQA